MTFITSNLVIAGLSDKSSYTSASNFTTLQCASESFYAYNKDNQRLIGQALTGSQFIYSIQNDKIFWINEDKNGGDGKMYLSALSSTKLNYISSSVEEKHVIFYNIGELKTGDTTSIPSNTVTTAEDVGVSNIFNIKSYSSNLYTYSLFDGASSIFTVPGLYTSSLLSSSLITNGPNSSSISIIFNLFPSGTFAWQAKQFTQFNNTCSIEISYPLNVPGVVTYNSFNNNEKFFNNFLLIVSSSLFNTSSVSGIPVFAESTLYSSSYNSIPIYFKNDNQNYGIFDVSGSYMTHFRPGMTINVGGFDVIINGSQYETESIFILTPDSSATFPPNHVTRVYTMTNPFNGNMYVPINISFGNSSYTLGRNLISQTDNQLIAGTYNQTGSYDKLFIVGNGYAENNRKDAFAINTQGVTILGSTNAIVPTTVLGGIYFDGTDFYLGM